MASEQSRGTAAWGGSSPLSSGQHSLPPAWSAVLALARPATSFTKFPELALELQRQIWTEFYRQPRKHEFRFEDQGVVESRAANGVLVRVPVNHTFIYTQTKNAGQQTNEEVWELDHLICKEARAVALRIRQPFRPANTDPAATQAQSIPDDDEDQHICQDGHYVARINFDLDIVKIDLGGSLRVGIVREEWAPGIRNLQLKGAVDFLRYVPRYPEYYSYPLAEALVSLELCRVYSIRAVDPYSSHRAEYFWTRNDNLRRLRGIDAIQEAFEHVGVGRMKQLIVPEYGCNVDKDEDDFFTGEGFFHGSEAERLLRRRLEASIRNV